MAISDRPMTTADQKARYDERGYVTSPRCCPRRRSPSCASALDELLAGGGRAARRRDDDREVLVHAFGHR